METTDGRRGALVGALTDTGCRFNAHDLLWVADPASYSSESDMPAWATGAWLSKAPAVVRRDKRTDPDCIPVGMRGATREQRHKAHLRRGSVARWATPEMLTQAAVLDDARRLAQFAAIDALLKIAPVLDALQLAWGPTGSVGFTLASGIVVLRPTSDLDLVIRAPQALERGMIDALCAMHAHAHCRLDMQIDTGHGAFSLAEWAQGRRQVLLKTDSGPVLTDTPWDEPARPVNLVERPA